MPLKHDETWSSVFKLYQALSGMSWQVNVQWRVRKPHLPLTNFFLKQDRSLPINTGLGEGISTHWGLLKPFKATKGYRGLQDYNWMVKDPIKWTTMLTQFSTIYRELQTCSFSENKGCILSTIVLSWALYHVHHPAWAWELNWRVWGLRECLRVVQKLFVIFYGWEAW